MSGHATSACEDGFDTDVDVLEAFSRRKAACRVVPGKYDIMSDVP